MSVPLTAVDGRQDDSPWWRLSQEELAAIKAHPRFVEMMRASIVGALEMYDADTVTSGALRDMGRFVAGMMALYLHASGGLTLTRLRAVCAEVGISGRGRAMAILTMLRVIGYVTAAEGIGDARVRPYVPTEAMVTAFRQRIRIELQAFSLVDPDMDAVISFYDRPDGFDAYMRHAGGGLITAITSGATPATDLDIFAERAAGILILYQLVLGGEEGDTFPPRRPIRASVNGLAKRFKVSRTHVMRLLRDGETEGFFRRAPEAGEGYVVLAKPEAIEQHFAAGLLLLGSVARRAAGEAAA